jgi:Protein of unknown function (DUF3089)
MQWTCLSHPTSPHRPRLLAISAALLAITLLTASGATAATTGHSASTSGAATVWLCKPGAADDPCTFSTAATALQANGKSTSAAFAELPATTASKFDCFYVYPTVSEQNAANTDLTIGKAEIDVAVDQASPFSRVCNVWAPMYRSETSESVAEGLGGNTSLLHSTFTVAYDSVLSSWKDFLAHDDNGRPIVLIGDSQGSAILIHLIATEIETNPAVLHRLVVAIIAGGNLQVPTGKSSGATFTEVPLCTNTSEIGCAIAFSSFPSQPPSDSLFGRPGQGVSLQSGQSTKNGVQVACVNPAALRGGTADPSPYFLAATQGTLPSSVTTPWVTYPGLYSATCKSSGGANWLQVTDLATKSDTRPVVSETLGPTWGYHADDLGLFLGNLVGDVATEELAFASASH